MIILTVEEIVFVHSQNSSGIPFSLPKFLLFMSNNCAEVSPNVGLRSTNSCRKFDEGADFTPLVG